MRAQRVRVLTVATAAVSAGLAVGLYRQEAWATWAWPWQDSRLVGIFLASILAAFSASLLWVAIVNEPAALEGIAMDVAAAGLGLGWLALISVLSNDASDRLPYVFGLLIVLTLGLRVATWSTRQPTRDAAPQPRFATVALASFVVTLIVVGGAMVLGWGAIFPWNAPTDTRRAIGVIFLGAGSYFLVGLRRRTWVHTGGQLAGFLAYDTVLIGPYVRAFLDRNDTSESGSLSYGRYGTATTGDDRVFSLNLGLYIAVLVISALVAAYYLALDPRTRIWRHVRALLEPHGSPTQRTGEPVVSSPADVNTR